MTTNAIRPGEPNDFSFIDSFDIFAGDRTQEIKEGRLFVLVDEDKPVGYITMARDGFHGYPYIQFLCVHEDWRRRGIASRLLTHCESMNAGRRVFLSTESNNSAMLELLGGRKYVRAGAISGLNRDGSEEVFYHKNV